MDMTLWMDVLAVGCMVYCLYTWVRLLREGKLFPNSLLVPKEKKPADCRDEAGYVAYLRPRLGILPLVMTAYTVLIVLDDVLKAGWLPYPWQLLPLGVLLAALIWYAAASAKALREYFD